MLFIRFCQILIGENILRIAATNVDPGVILVGEDYLKVRINVCQY